MNFTVLSGHRIKLKESGKRDQYLDFANELKKKNLENEGDGDTNCNWFTWNNSKRIAKGTGRLGNKRRNGDYPDINKFGQNTAERPRDLRWLTVTQTPVRTQQLTLEWKTLKRK